MTTTGVMCHLALVSQFLTDPEGRGGEASYGILWLGVLLLLLLNVNLLVLNLIKSSG